ncbi:hypothetical protein KEH51_02610 [[Brevibacterium] frigoritolerans]|uniref:Uncharacterized protein n=1 Tax=Peribacillus frigoritolerans TaxID=450367 RepID=A0A941FHD7_9BACI|nr:hypothetical protein [Peribacillus frigoritolerans]
MTLGRSVLSKSSSKVDWSRCSRLLLRKARLGRPRRRKPRADRPRKAMPYVPINVPIGQTIKIDKLDFYRVCLQSESRTH